VLLAQWGPGPAGQWETSIVRQRNMDQPHCW
jgi:hypothetical protein